MKIARNHFRNLVSEIAREVITSLPHDLHNRATEVLIIAEDSPPAAMDDDELLGLYDGIPLPERSIDGQPLFPDRIFVYRLPLMRMCRNIRELRREIRATIIHELGHFFGFDEDDLERMGLE